MGFRQSTRTDLVGRNLGYWSFSIFDDADVSIPSSTTTTMMMTTRPTRATGGFLGPWGTCEHLGALWEPEGPCENPGSMGTRGPCGNLGALWGPGGPVGIWGLGGHGGSGGSGGSWDEEKGEAKRGGKEGKRGKRRMRRRRKGWRRGGTSGFGIAKGMSHFPYLPAPLHERPSMLESTWPARHMLGRRGRQLSDIAFSHGKFPHHRPVYTSPG